MGNTSLNEPQHQNVSNYLKYNRSRMKIIITTTTMK